MLDLRVEFAHATQERQDMEVLHGLLPSSLQMILACSSVSTSCTEINPPWLSCRSPQTWASSFQGLAFPAHRGQSRT